MKEIKIHVIGLACTGKSTIIALLNKTLVENGFQDVNIHTNDFTDKDKFLKSANSNLDKKVDALKDRITIDIHETNLKYSMNEPAKIVIDPISSKRCRIVKVSNDVGSPHGNGIEAGYEFIGFPIAPPSVGFSFIVSGDNGNIFRTSTVTKILTLDTFKTRNSTYRIDIIE